MSTRSDGTGGISSAAVPRPTVEEMRRNLRIAEDYRVIDEEKLKSLLLAAQEKAGAGDGYAVSAWKDNYAMGPFPGDRSGLLAAVHPALDPPDEEQMRALFDYARGRRKDLPQSSSRESAVHAMARAFATRLKRRVYVATTEAQWHLVLLASEGGWYDDHPGGEYANDQYIAHYDADGTFHFDGCS